MRKKQPLTAVLSQRLRYQEGKTGMVLDLIDHRGGVYHFLLSDSQVVELAGWAQGRGGPEAPPEIEESREPEIEDPEPDVADSGEESGPGVAERLRRVMGLGTSE